jgi:hypothetical protein
MQVYETRIYFRPQSGEIVHVHQLAAGPGDALDRERVLEEMNAFGSAVEQRMGEIDFLIVEESDILTDGRPLSVDIEHRRLVARDRPSASS